MGRRVRIYFSLDVRVGPVRFLPGVRHRVVPISSSKFSSTFLCGKQKEGI